MTSERGAVVLLSGGLDSYTAAAMLKAQGFRLYALSVRYGQRHVRELESAPRVASALGTQAHLELSVDLAQMQEGRLSMRQVEEARIVENAKWIAFYDAQYTLEKARWNVLRLTGDLVGTIEAIPATP